MKELYITRISYIMVCAILFSSCGTIVGGSYYKAYFNVPTSPNARIYLNNNLIGTGSAFATIKRANADKLDITVKNDGCQDQIFSYRARVFRGWALFFSIIGWTGAYSGIPLPWGVVVDAATGSLWKPSVYDQGIQKIDYKSYRYVLNYTGCQEAGDNNNVKNKDNGLDQIFLFNGSIIKGFISEEEPNKSLKITDSAGNIFVFKMEEIQKIVRGRK